MTDDQLRKCLSKGQCLEYTWKPCGACTGKGERRESISYYDVDWVTCYGCQGRGQKLVYAKITCGHSPFMRAVD